MSMRSLQNVLDLKDYRRLLEMEHFDWREYLRSILRVWIEPGKFEISWEYSVKEWCSKTFSVKQKCRLFFFLLSLTSEHLLFDVYVSLFVALLLFRSALPLLLRFWRNYVDAAALAALKLQYCVIFRGNCAYNIRKFRAQHVFFVPRCCKTLAGFVSSWFDSSRSFKIWRKEDRDRNRENGAVKKRVPQDSSVNHSFKYHAVFFNFNCSCIANFFQL